jgi:small subunit ribosomal protein S6e
MATFTAVVSDPETGLSYQVDVDGQDGNRFVSREIGDSVEGDAIGLPGYTVEITGGSDAAGRPLHEEVGGSDLSEVLLAEGPGYRPTRDGERRRVTVRGREIGEQTVQLNLRIDERGDDHVEVLLGDADPEDFADEGEDEDEETEEPGAEDVDEESPEPDEENAEDADGDEDEAEESADTDADESAESEADPDEEDAEVEESDDDADEEDETAEAEESDDDSDADEDDEE